MNMKKKYVWVLTFLLCLCFLLCTAHASRYCKDCKTVTSWKPNCVNELQYNTNYQQHDLSNGSTCNYYDQYFKTFEVCSVCENWVNKYQVNGHLECSLHQICGGFRRCPF